MWCVHVCVREWERGRVHVWGCLLANFHMCMCVCVSSLWAWEEKLFHHRLDCMCWAGGARQKKRGLMFIYTHHCLDTGIFKLPGRILLYTLLIHLLECWSVKELISTQASVLTCTSRFGLSVCSFCCSCLIQVFSTIASGTLMRNKLSTRGTMFWGAWMRHFATMSDTILESTRDA